MTDEPTTDTIPDAAEIAPPAVRAIIDAPVMRPMTTPMLGEAPPTTTATATPQPDVPSWMSTLPGTTPEDIAAKMRNLGVITANSFETLPTQGIAVGTRATVNGGTWDAGEWVWAGTTWVKSSGAGQVLDVLTTPEFDITTAQWLINGYPHVGIRIWTKSALTVSGKYEKRIATYHDSSYAPDMAYHVPAFCNADATGFAFMMASAVVCLENYTDGVTLPAGKIISSVLTWPCLGTTSHN